MPVALAQSTVFVVDDDPEFRESVSLLLESMKLNAEVFVSAEDFNFARDYGDYWRKNSKNPGSMQIRRNVTLSCLRKDFGQVTPESMMKINRNHLEGTIAEPRWGASETFWATPCAHDSPRGGYHTAASMVAHLRAEKPPILRQVYWAGFSNPCSNAFKPFYMHGPKVPSIYAQGTSKYSEDSPWWSANRVRLLADLNHKALAPTVQGVFARTEAWERERQQRVEGNVEKLVRAGREEEAVQLLQEFVNENTQRIEKEYRMLNKTLPEMLETVGIEYLHTDYMRDWTVKTGVPLPLR